MYMTENTMVMVAVNGAGEEGRLGALDGGGELQGPQHGCGGVGIDALGGEHTAHFALVVSQIAGRFGDEQARESNAATGASHIVQASAGVEMMATAGASANGGTLAVAAIGESVAAGTDNQRLQGHRDLRRVIGSG